MQRYETNHRKRVVEENLNQVWSNKFLPKTYSPCFGFAVNYQEMICSEWVQTRGYQACVFCKLIPLRVCLSESAHLMQTFLKNLRPPKTRLPPNPLLFPYHIIQIIFHCHNFFHRHALKDRHPHFVFNPKERVDTKNQKGNSGYAPDS